MYAILSGNKAFKVVESLLDSEGPMDYKQLSRVYDWLNMFNHDSNPELMDYYACKSELLLIDFVLGELEGRHRRVSAALKAKVGKAVE